jgi:drug/metabolite transporter (DMT)-like permease
MGGMFIKLVPWHPLAVAGMRSLIAAIVILPFLGLKNLKFEKADVVTAIFYALTVTLFVSATKLTTAANAVFLQYTAPVYVVGMAHFFLKERVTKFDLSVVGVVLFGMALFFYEKMSLEGFWGNILAIISGVTFATMTCLIRTRKENPLKPVFLGNVITALALSYFIVVAPPMDVPSWSYMITLGVFQLGLAYIFYGLAVPHVQALETVLVATLEPILNPIWVYFSLGEVPSSLSIAGGALIVAAITFRSIMSRNLTPETQSGFQPEPLS